jgi:hypothetical protein
MVRSRRMDGMSSAACRLYGHKSGERGAKVTGAKQAQQTSR